MKTVYVDGDLQLGNVSALDPEALLRWADTNYGNRAAIITSFQNTGCVIIDMARRVAPGLRVVTIDTLRLHRETYDLIRQIESRYGIIVERFTPNPERLRQMIEQHGEFLFFDSKAKQEICCRTRKLEPNGRALATVDVWIAGLRRVQSAGRSNTKKAALVYRGGRPIVKLCPIADWTDEDVKTYVAERNVPSNDLYRRGYTSIGCEICSTPTLPWEDIRAGRWRWFNYLGKELQKECGLHVDGSGI